MSHAEALDLAHILLVVLVFALEIPVLIVEASADDRIRHLLHKRASHRLVTALMVMTLALVVVLLATYDRENEAHHADNDTVRDVAASVPVTTDTSVNVSSGGRGVAKRIASAIDDSVTLSATLRGASIAMLVLFGVCWLFMMKVDVRTKLVSMFARRLKSAFARQPSLPEHVIEDLVSLGEHGAPGHERAIVIRAIDDICAATLRDRRYTGNELGVLLHGLERIARGGEDLGTTGNMFAAISVLRRCSNGLASRGFDREHDVAAIVETTSGIGETAVEGTSDAVAYACLEIAPDTPQISFRIGVAALRVGNYRVGAAALSRLKGLWDENGRIPRELFGLLGHFNEAGPSAAFTAQRALNELDRSAQALTGAAEEAAQAYYKAGDFVTCDAVRTVAAEFKKRREAAHENCGKPDTTRRRAVKTDGVRSLTVAAGVTALVVFGAATISRWRRRPAAKQL